MAEVYGEKPKIFTKEWWPYYWLYYKWHTIAVLFVAMLVVIALVECAKKEVYDLRITYFGQSYYEESMWDTVENTLEADIKDVDGNGEKNIGILPLVIVDNKEYIEQNTASYLKHDAEFADGLMYLFIYDKKELELRMEDDFVSESFIETDEWLRNEVASDKLIYDKNNKSYAVSLKDSSILKSAGINGDDLYVLIKNDTEAAEKNPKARKNAIIAANKLIK